MLVLLVFMCRLFAQLRCCQRLVLRLLLQLRYLTLDAFCAPVAAQGLQGTPGIFGLALQQVMFQPGAGFRHEFGAFLIEPLPFTITVDLELVLFQAVAQRFKLVFDCIKFLSCGFLVAARLGVAVEHVLVAKHLKHQVEQFAR